MGTKANPGPFDCYAKLEPNEPYFLIMGRDPMGQQLVEMWCSGAELWLSSKYGSPGNDNLTFGAWMSRERAKISEARAVAEAMATYCRGEDKIPMRWSGVAPVITRAPAKTTVTRTKVEEVLKYVDDPWVSAIVIELARAAGVPE